MKMLTSAELFGPPKRTRRIRKTKDWFERAKLVIAEARDRAVETAQQRAMPAMKRPPTPIREVWIHDEAFAAASLSENSPVAKLSHAAPMHDGPP